MAAKINKSPYLTTAEASAITGRPTRTITDWAVKHPEIVYFRKGRLLLLDRVQFEKFVLNYRRRLRPWPAVAVAGEVGDAAD